MIPAVTVAARLSDARHGKCLKGRSGAMPNVVAAKTAVGLRASRSTEHTDPAILSQVTGWPLLRAYGKTGSHETQAI